MKTIEIKKEDLTPDQIATNFFNQRDLDFLNNQIDALKRYISTLADKNYRLQSQFNELFDYKWENKTLQSMREELETIKVNSSRGFPISKKAEEKINNWQMKHDKEIHNNPASYHGCSGGGFEYSFYPTGLGTISYCICSTCKSKAIKEYGTNWFEHCDGIFEFTEDFG